MFGRTRLIAIVAVLLITAGFAGLAGAETPANAAFERTWARTDQPVATGQVNRTWMWGPQANSGPLSEPYADAPGGNRTVQYYDKSRMEDNSYRATAPWDVTNGLLVVEMVTGQLQTGDTQFESRSPAAVNIAGDPGEHPTYADINTFGLRSTPATPVGTVLTTWMDATGIMATPPATPPTTVTAAERSTTTGLDHTVASVFWDFMTSSGTVYENGQSVQGTLFETPYYATGLPITEAYWSVVRISGTPQTVLWQCFERRCLTYNPLNGPGWQVEAGNVGQHYFAWRSSGTGVTPEPNPTEPPIITPTPNPNYETFADGTWRVGKDIQAGTYRSSDTVDYCYWERLSSDSDTVQDVIANDTSLGRTVVTIETGDAYFDSEGCGTWSSDLSPITTSPTANFADGTWIVGVDIAPGAWRNDLTTDGCYWELVSDFSGSIDAVIKNGDYTQTGAQTVTIAPSDKAFKSMDCGTWTRVGN